VRLSLSTFFLIKSADSRVAESGNRCGKPNGTSQIGRTSLRHFATSTIEVAGLLDRRVDSCKGGQLSRTIKSTHITDFAEDYSSKCGADTGNSGELGIKACQQFCNFKINF
jgi:hypothetical protein